VEIKGTAVKPTKVFVKDKFSNRYIEWLNSLSENSRNIMTDNILISMWYPIKDAFIEPTQKVCELFYNGNTIGAKELGMYSADIGLKGVYKIFVRIGSPKFLLKRASMIFSTYYSQSEIELIEISDNKAIMHISKFPEPHELIDLRICGWIERALEISGCRNVKIDITKSLAKGDKLTEFVSEWK